MFKASYCLKVHNAHFKLASAFQDSQQFKLPKDIVHRRLEENNRNSTRHLYV